MRRLIVPWVTALFVLAVLCASLPASRGHALGLRLEGVDATNLSVAADLPRLPQDLDQGGAGVPSACGVMVSESIAPENPRICEEGAVDVTLAVTCPTSLPIRMVIAVDRSKSIADTSDPIAADILRNIKQSIRQVLDAIDFEGNPETKVGVISHGFRVTVETELTNEASRVTGAVNGIRYLASDLGEDPPEAIDKARQMLEEERQKSPDVQPIEIILLYGDGCDVTVPGCAGAARSSGARAEGAGMAVMAVCYKESPRETCNQSYRQIVSESSYYYESRPSRLPRAIEELREEGESLTLEDLTLTEVLGDDIGYLAGSGSPAPGVVGQRLSFAFAGVAPGQAVSATYKIRPGIEGMLPLRTEASQVTFEDSIGRSTDPITVPLRTLDVGPCLQATATPTAVPTEEPTELPTETATPAVSPTPEPKDPPPDTPTPLPSATPETRFVHLPILLKQVCNYEPATTTDIMLVIDASSSMEEESGGLKKIDAARAAAQTFVGLLDPETDRAGVIAFNVEPRLVTVQSNDLTAVQATIGGIQTGAGTRIDLALEMAYLDLLGDVENGSAWRDADRMVLILMTDGRPDPGTRELVERMARDWADPRIVVYTIGLGDDVDPDLLRMIASSPGNYLQAPSADQLSGIYEALADDLPCPSGVIWGKGGP